MSKTVAVVAGGWSSSFEGIDTRVVFLGAPQVGITLILWGC